MRERSLLRGKGLDGGVIEVVGANYILKRTDEEQGRGGISNLLRGDAVTKAKPKTCLSVFVTVSK